MTTCPRCQKPQAGVHTCVAPAAPDVAALVARARLRQALSHEETIVLCDALEAARVSVDAELDAATVRAFNLAVSILQNTVGSVGGLSDAHVPGVTRAIEILKQANYGRPAQDTKGGSDGE